MNKIYSWRSRHVTAVPRLLRYTVARRGQPFAACALLPRKGFTVGLMRAKDSISALQPRRRMGTRRKQRRENAPPPCFLRPSPGASLKAIPGCIRRNCGQKIRAFSL